MEAELLDKFGQHGEKGGVFEKDGISERDEQNCVDVDGKGGEWSAEDQMRLDLFSSDETQTPVLGPPPSISGRSLRSPRLVTAVSFPSSRKRTRPASDQSTTATTTKRRGDQRTFEIPRDIWSGTEEDLVKTQDSALTSTQLLLKQQTRGVHAARNHRMTLARAKGNLEKCTRTYEARLSEKDAELSQLRSANRKLRAKNSQLLADKRVLISRCEQHDKDRLVWGSTLVQIWKDREEFQAGNYTHPSLFDSQRHPCCYNESSQGTMKSTMTLQPGSFGGSFPYPSPSNTDMTPSFSNPNYIPPELMGSASNAENVSFPPPTFHSIMTDAFGLDICNLATSGGSYSGGGLPFDPQISCPPVPGWSLPCNSLSNEFATQPETWDFDVSVGTISNAQSSVLPIPKWTASGHSILNDCSTQLGARDTNGHAPALSNDPSPSEGDHWNQLLQADKPCLN